MKGLAGFFDIARVRLNWFLGRYRGLNRALVSDGGVEERNGDSQ